MASELICFFQDYLADVAPRDKVGILNEAGAEVLAHPESDRLESSQPKYGRLPRRQYSRLVDEFRRIFARNASRALSSLILAGPESAAVHNLSGASQETLYVIAKEFPDGDREDREFPARDFGERSLPIHQQLSFWAIDPRNWYLIASNESPVTLQSRISAGFPALVFGNGPIECASVQDAEIQLDHLEDILQNTGIYTMWGSGHMGHFATAVVLDTGVAQSIM